MTRTDPAVRRRSTRPVPTAPAVAALTAALAVSAAVLAAPAAAPATAATKPFDVLGSAPVFPGLEHQEIRFPLDDGRHAVANVLVFKANDPLLELRPILGQDRVPGLETVPSVGRRKLAEGAVAGVNGGFWLQNPVGDPNSFLSISGRLVSESETQGAGPRGTFARRGDGSLVMDRLDTTITLRINETDPARIVTAVNRFPRSTPPYPDDTVQPIYLYTPDFGGAVTVEPIVVNDVPQPVRVLVIEGLVPKPSGASRGVVDAVPVVPGQVPIPRAGTVVVAHGTAATELAAVVPGDEVRIDVQIKPADSAPEEWEQTVDALAAGPLIVRRGERVDPSSWEDEGFAPATHSNVRHPRSAVALTADGRVLLVTVDGRQPGYSSGMTMHELSHFLRLLGARDGLSLDGGGSSQFVVDGVLRNRPCCDRGLRPVATSLFVFHRYAFASTDRIAGAGREATAAAVALAGYPEGAEEVLIAAAANFPDALAGGPLAYRLDAPLLLSGRDELPVPTLDALAKLQPERVTILGGGGAVSAAVEERLRGRYEVRRLGGKSRVETATAIARAMGEAHERVFLASGERFPDALSAAGPGGRLGMPILLTDGSGLPAPTAEHLERFGVDEVVIVGGPGAVPPAVEEALRAAGLKVTRLAGTSRFGTAAAVNRWTIPRMPRLNDTGLVVAAGGSFADALAGGPLAAQRRQLLMIAPGHDLGADPEAKAFFDEFAARELRKVTLIGGHSALSSYVQWQLDTLAAQ